MKLFLHTLLLSIILVSAQPNVNAQTRSLKKEEQKKQFQEIVELVQKGVFIFEARRAFPQGGASIDLTTNYGFVKVNVEEAKGHLPFFGRAYSVDFGGGGGIIFDGKMKDLKIERHPRRMRILYSFEVKNNDTYRLSMDIGLNGNATLSVNSNNRSTISYSGEISAVEE